MMTATKPHSSDEKPLAGRGPRWECFLIALAPVALAT